MNIRVNRISGWGLVALVLVAAVGAAADGRARSEPVISACDKPMIFGFGSWEGAPKDFAVRSDGIHISANSGQGGAGIAGLDVNVAGYGDWSPAVTLAVGPRNRAGSLMLQLVDAGGTRHSYHFDLRKLKPGKPQQLTPDFGASLAAPEKAESQGTAPGVSRVLTWLLIGDWSGGAVDLVVSRIVLVPPTAELRAGRVKLRELHAREAEQARAEAEAKAAARRKLLDTGAPHPADGPKVQHICAVAADVIAVTIQAGQHVSNRLVPYVAEPGDELVEQEKDQPQHEVKDGKIVDYYVRSLFRKVDNQRTKVGLLSPDGKWVFIERATQGQLLDETVVDEPEAYRVGSPDDARCAVPRAPIKVFRKGKPNGYSMPLPFIYTISLRLSSPLVEGAGYTIRFVGVNTSQEAVEYVHKPGQTESIALHAIQTGYRPDDPYKRACLSFWMGVDRDGRSGSCTPQPDRFELVDEAGKTVFTGKPETAKAADQEEQISIHEKLDYTKAAVRRLDFSGFRTPGQYRVFVPGLGLSGPFRIAADVWEKPFKAAMQGILAQRQAIDLGPPACRFTRTRAFHPDDGVEFYQMTIPVQAGQEGTRGENLVALAAAGRLRRVTGVWGGYQDAGDWDSLGGHLSATYDLLGLYDLNPEAFARVRLSLPASDHQSGLPDLLSEALWQMPLWRRLQMPDGGVRGGYGYGWGCPPATTSSMIRSAGVYSVDQETTMHYAAAAARAARVLEALGRKPAARYLASARQAWQWCEAHSSPNDPIYRQVLALDKEFPKNLRDKRAMAAVELLAATRAPVFDEAFRQSSELSGEPKLYLDQLAADFAYARLPDGLGSPEFKRRAVERLTAYADHAIAFSRKNAYDIIAGVRTDYPLIFACRYFSTPAQGGFALIYAYELTKKPVYLAAAVQGANYSLGANPDNLCYCTGIGYRPQHFNFIVDAQITGQLPDVIVGHIPYGQGNEGSSMSRPMNSWVQQWLLNFGPAKKMVPNWYDWPVNEQYIDFAKYPLHNETCFNATTVPAACYWFYLHTRP
jgi:endoglucanase